MLPDFYYFRKSLTQEQIDKFADAMIKQPKPVVKKDDDDGLDLPHLNFALIYNFAPDDDEEVAAEVQAHPKSQKNRQRVSVQWSNRKTMLISAATQTVKRRLIF